MRRRDQGFARTNPFAGAFISAGADVIGLDRYFLMYCCLCKTLLDRVNFLYAVVSAHDSQFSTIKNTLESVQIPVVSYDCDDAEVISKLLAPAHPELLNREFVEKAGLMDLALRKAHILAGERYNTFEIQTLFVYPYEQHYRAFHGADPSWSHSRGYDTAYYSTPFEGPPGGGAGPGDSNRYPLGLLERKIDSKRYKSIDIDLTLLRNGHFVLLMETFRPQDNDKQTYLTEGLADRLGIDWCPVKYECYDEDEVWIRGKKKRPLDEFVRIVIDKYSPDINPPVTHQ